MSECISKKIGRGKVHITFKNWKRYVCGLEISGQYDTPVEPTTYEVLYKLSAKGELCMRCLDRIQFKDTSQGYQARK